MHLCIFEDQSVKNLHPLTLLNPVFELRCGCTTLREKILSLLPSKNIAYLTRAYLNEYVHELYPNSFINRLPDDDILFVNGRVIADESLNKFFKKIKNKEAVAVAGNTIVAAYVKKNRCASFVQRQKNGEWILNHDSTLPTVQVQSKVAEYPWELVSSNGEEIEKDFVRIYKKGSRLACKIYAGAYLLNKKQISIGKGSVIKPGVVLDAEHGPIVIGKTVAIMPNAVIEGPVCIGDNATIKIGAKIYGGTSIGAHCKIGGEVTRSIIQSYSNKAHDGFVGDSYIGSWVNLGADTNTSNLKNTYGNVSVTINGKTIDSGQQFVGLTMGDHSKSGINVMFNTGTVVGVSCNIFGANLPQKYIPSFSWGSSDSMSVFDVEKSREVARRMMLRRGIRTSSAYEKLIHYIFEQTEKEREQWLKK